MEKFDEKLKKDLLQRIANNDFIGGINVHLAGYVPRNVYHFFSF
jgi:hypothetical protein